MAFSKFHFYRPQGAVIIEGSDSAEFLQGQFSQDLRVESGARVYGLWLNPKGKILGDSFLLKESETAFRAFSYRCDTEAIRSNLEERIIMDEVETRPADDWWGLSLWGEAIDRANEQLGGTLPSESEFECAEGIFKFWGQRSAEKNLEIVSPDRSALDALVKSLEENDIQGMDADAVSLRAIEDGHFEVGIDALDSDLPQEVGLGESAVAYNKGCYIGQEVMARLKSMGRPRRSLEAVSLSARPEGTGPWSLKTKDGGRAGELRRVVDSPDGASGSAMLKRSVTESELVLEGQESLTATRRSNDFKE